MQTQYQQENIRLHDMLEQKMKLIKDLQQKNKVYEDELEKSKFEIQQYEALTFAYEKNVELSTEAHDSLVSLVKSFIIMTLSEEYTHEDSVEFAQGLSELTMFSGALEESSEVTEGITKTEDEPMEDVTAPDEN